MNAVDSMSAGELRLQQKIERYHRERPPFFLRWIQTREHEGSLYFPIKTDSTIFHKKRRKMSKVETQSLLNPSQSHPTKDESLFVKNDILINISFFWFGLSSFVTFMMIVSSLATFDSYMFPRVGYSTACPYSFSIGQFASNVVLAWFPNLYPPTTLLFSYGALAVISAGYLLIVLAARETFFGFYISLALAFVQFWFLTASLSTGFAFASFVSSNIPAVLALGIGVSGVIPLLVGLTLMKLSHFCRLVTLFSISGVICAANFYILPRLEREPIVADKLAEIRASRSTDIESAEAKGQVSKTAIIEKIWALMAAAGLASLVLFIVYPTLCSFMRNEDHFGSTIIGLQNVGELIGRFFVSLGFVLPYRLLLLVGLLRIAFVPLYRSIYNFPLEHWIRSEATCYTLQIVQGLTFGHLTSSCFVLAPKQFEKFADKQRAGYWTTIANNLGFSFGAFCFAVLVGINYLPVTNNS